jgi:hypothetical protein
LEFTNNNNRKIFRGDKMNWREWEIIPTSTTHEECLLLAELVKSMPFDAVMVELGTGLGCTACVLGHKGNKVYSYDSYVESEYYVKWLEHDHPEQLMPWTYEQALKNVAKLNATNVILLNTTSTQTELVPDSVDFIWIDAGHDYNSAYNDIKNWLPKMKDNFIMCGHDYDIPAVAKAVQDLLPNHYNKGRIWISEKSTEIKERCGDIKTFLICGCYRSGTTYLARTLNAHPEIICTNELGIYHTDKKTFDGFLLEQKINNTKTGLREKIKCDPPPPYTTQNVLNTIKINADSKIKWYGDKYPQYTKNMCNVSKYVDKVLCCIRDPREVMESQIRRWYDSPFCYKQRMDNQPWSRESIYECITENIRGGGNWLSYMDSWTNWKKTTKIPWLEIHYSKFPHNAEEIANFLEIDAYHLKKVFYSNFKKQTNQCGKAFTEGLPTTWKNMMEKYNLVI